MVPASSGLDGTFVVIGTTTSQITAAAAQVDPTTLTISVSDQVGCYNTITLNEATGAALLPTGVFIGNVNTALFSGLVLASNSSLDIAFSVPQTRLVAGVVSELGNGDAFVQRQGSVVAYSGLNPGSSYYATATGGLSVVSQNGSLPLVGLATSSDTLFLGSS